MKLCGKQDESRCGIQWSTGVRGQGVKFAKQCIVASEQSWPDRSLGESQRVEIGGRSQEGGSVAVLGIDRTVSRGGRPKNPGYQPPFGLSSDSGPSVILICSASSLDFDTPLSVLVRLFCGKGRPPYNYVL
jgi:hypothetical protein